MGPDLRPGWLENPIIEFVHRFISFAGLVLLGVSGWLGRRSADARLRVYPWVALACGIGSAVFGMMIILFTLPLALGLLDLAFALVAMALIAVTDAALRRTHPAGDAPTPRVLARVTLVLLFAMHLLGSIVAGTTTDGTGSFTRCLSWPLWALVEVDGAAAPQGVRMVLAGAAALLILAVGWRLWRGGARVLAAVLVGALAVEQGLGIAIVAAGVSAGQTNGIQATVAVLYSALAVVILAAISLAVARTLPPAGRPA